MKNEKTTLANLELAGLPQLGLISLYVKENAGIRSIAHYLRKHGFRVVEIYFKDWINNAFVPPSKHELKNLINVLKSENINLTGISVRASGYHGVAALLTKHIQNELGIPVIWGGMHVTSLPEQCIEVADAIFIGEAERSMLQLMQNLTNFVNDKTLEGFWFKNGSEIIKNNPAPLVEDLDEVAFRDFHGSDKYYIQEKKILKGDPFVNETEFPIMASRGCPFSSCSFCSNDILKTLYRGKSNITYYRRRSIQNVIEELKYAKVHFKRLKKIRFDDESFCLESKYVDEFSSCYEKEVNLPFEIIADPRWINEPALIRLKRAGMTSVSMGIQNSEKINKELYGRNIKDQRILECGYLLHKLKLRVNYQVILDDPVSGNEDKKNFFRFLLTLPRPFELYLFSLTYYPGTKLSKELVAKGIISEDDVEGRATKIFEQYRVDLAYPRNREDKFWVSLIVLVSKNFIPKSLLKLLAGSEYLKKNPALIVFMAQISNIIKMIGVLVELAAKRELTLTIIKRWANFKSLITQ